MGFALEGFLDVFHLLVRIMGSLDFEGMDCGDGVEEFLSLLVDGDVECFFKFEKNGAEIKGFFEGIKRIVCVFEANLMVLILGVKTGELQEVEGKLVFFGDEGLQFIKLTFHVPFEIFL